VRPDTRARPPSDRPLPSVRSTVSPAANTEDLALALLLAGARATVAAARLAALPAQVAMRAPLLGPLLERRLQALAIQARGVQLAMSELPEALARSLAEHRIIERIVGQLLASMDVEQTVQGVLDDERARQAAERIAERVLQSEEFQRAIEQLASSPALRAALLNQGTSLASETADSVRDTAESLDATIERIARGLIRRPRTQEP
jgi:hypothetical protein